MDEKKIGEDAKKTVNRMEISNVEREKAAILKSHADHLEKDAVRATVEQTPYTKPNTEQPATQTQKPAPKETQKPAQKPVEAPKAAPAPA